MFWNILLIEKRFFMFEIINESNKEIDDLDFINSYIKFLVKEEKLNNALFNIIFVNNEKIREINNTYRNIDRETDVISFALEDYQDIILKDNLRMLGDIYISVDKAYLQAIEYNHSNLREICFLITHGLLHLLGYDHMTKEDEEVMFKKQEDYLQKFDIKR